MLKKVADVQDVVPASCNDAVMLSESETGLYPAPSEVEMRIRERAVARSSRWSFGVQLAVTCTSEVLPTVISRR